MKPAKSVTFSFAVALEEAEEFERILDSSEYPVNRSAVFRSMFLTWLKEHRHKSSGD